MTPNKIKSHFILVRGHTSSDFQKLETFLLSHPHGSAYWSYDFFQERALRNLTVQEVIQEAFHWYGLPTLSQNGWSELISKHHLSKSHEDRLWGSLEFIERVEWALLPIFLTDVKNVILKTSFKLTDVAWKRLDSYLKRLQKETQKNIYSVGWDSKFWTAGQINLNDFQAQLKSQDRQDKAA